MSLAFYVADYCVPVLKQTIAEKASLAALQSTPTKTMEAGDANAEIQRSIEDKERVIDIYNKFYRLLLGNSQVDKHTGLCEERPLLRLREYDEFADRYSQTFLQTLRNTSSQPKK